MFGWFSNKEYAPFWLEYRNKFRVKRHENLEENRFVVFDTETTGLDTKVDRILSIGAVGVIGNVIDISDSFEIFVSQEKFNSNTVEIHGILKNGGLSKTSEKESLEEFVNFLGNSIIVAHHAAFDMEMINEGLKRMQLPKLKNKSLDTGVLYKKLNGVQNKHFGLDELCEEFNVAKHDRHTALGDAYITALLFLKIVSKMKKERSVSLQDLFIDRSGHGLF